MAGKYWFHSSNAFGGWPWMRMVAKRTLSSLNKIINQILLIEHSTKIKPTFGKKSSVRLSLEKTAMTWCFFVELKNIFDKLGGKTDQASILGLETFEIMLKIVDLLSVKNY